MPPAIRFLSAAVAALLLSAAAIAAPPKASPVPPKALVDRLEPLLSGGHRRVAANVPSSLQAFDDLSCNPDWVKDRDLESERLARAAEIAAAEPKALRALARNRSANSRYVIAALRLKTSLESDLLPDREEADDLMMRAADDGHPGALLYEAKGLLAQFPFYENIPNDPEKFVQINDLLRQAALGGSGEAAHLLALRSQKHVLEKFPGLRVIPGSEKPAAQWWALAAKLGDADGQVAYAKFGGLPPADQARWIEAAARAGSADANEEMARYFETGSNGKTKSLDEAARWHCRAIYFGSPRSPEALRKIRDAQAASPTPRPVLVPVEGRTMFDAGRGLNELDRLTASDFSSESVITPERAIEVSALKPDLYYCNGLCFVEASLRDASGAVLGKMRWQGREIKAPYNAFENRLILKAGQPYRVRIRAWGTRSVGFYTTGTGRQMETEGGRLETASSTQPERGSITFQLLK